MFLSYFTESWESDMRSFIVLALYVLLKVVGQAPTPPKEEPKKTDMFVDPDTIDKDECPEGIDPKYCK